MKRRGFLQALAGAVAAVFAPAVASKAAPLAEKYPFAQVPGRPHCGVQTDDRVMTRPAFDLIHDKGDHACGKIGWRCAVNPEVRPEMWPPMWAIFKVDGSHPKYAEPIFCGACGQPIHGPAGWNFSARPISEAA